MKIIPQKKRTRLNNCPVGLFLFDGTLAMMTEYCTGNGGVRQRDAYIVESGEYFWGGVNGDPVARGKLLVTPCDVEVRA